MFKSSKTKLLEEQLSVLQEELVSTKQKLQVTNTLFAGFLRQGDMNGYIIHVKSSGEIMNVSGAIYNVLGFLPEQIIGKRLSEITNTEDKRKVQECLCRELRYSGNIRRICRDNTFKIVESFASKQARIKKGRSRVPQDHFSPPPEAKHAHRKQIFTAVSAECVL